MTKRKYSKKFLERLKAVTSKRPKTVIEHILRHGFITTEELEQKYGYRRAESSSASMPGYVKAVIKRHLEE